MGAIGELPEETEVEAFLVDFGVELRGDLGGDGRDWKAGIESPWAHLASSAASPIEFCITCNRDDGVFETRRSRGFSTGLR